MATMKDSHTWGCEKARERYEGHDDLRKDITVIAKAIHAHDRQLHGKGAHTDLSGIMKKGE